MTSIFHYGLSRDLSLALNEADDFNVIIQVGESPNTKEFRVHSVILRARSPYFKSALSSKWITKKNDMIVYNKPNITPVVFDMIIIGNGTNWNAKNYRALKKTLSSFIPLIRFVEISPEDFFDKVRPYRAAMPNHIYEEIEEFHYKKIIPKTITLPSRIGTSASTMIDPSTIIKPKLATIIANWIDKNDSACNGQGPFILLVRVKSKKIYGGFNPIGYTLKEGQWLLSSDSFIFSFENNQDTRNMKIGRVINKSYSVYEDYYQFFFNFGNHLQAYKGNGQNFFYLGNHRIYSNIFNRSCTGDYPIEEIEEMEIFSVVRK
ncbi:2095_t:CDS:2 [Funneliformis geosporum]|uniref:2095_t:CDS:1 n=1 Tax=Funneliformis geosporum TaxID=1117311 RepID=A0A9W4SN81_9GLOM|nr:2095_t:CDS:2 [Funneliformis geosporum]